MDPKVQNERGMLSVERAEGGLPEKKTWGTRGKAMTRSPLG